MNNAIYMSMHNDVSFIIDSRLALYEAVDMAMKAVKDKVFRNTLYQEYDIE